MHGRQHLPQANQTARLIGEIERLRRTQLCAVFKPFDLWRWERCHLCLQIERFANFHCYIAQRLNECRFHWFG